MQPIFRKFLFIFLAILQIIAPLVHAHTHDNFAISGLHVPGLEAYDTAQLSSAMLSANGDLSDMNGLIVEIDSGFRQSAFDNIDDSHTIFYLPSQFGLTKFALSAFDTNFSPHFLIAHQALSFSLQAPRAPPQA